MKVTTVRKVATLNEAEMKATAAALAKAGVTLDTVTTVATDEATVEGAAAAAARLAENRRNVWKFAAVTCGGAAPTSGRPKDGSPVALGMATLFDALGSPESGTPEYDAARKRIVRFRWAGVLAVAFPSIGDERISTLATDAKAAREAFLSGTFPERIVTPRAPRPDAPTVPTTTPTTPDAEKVVATVKAKSREAADTLTTEGRSLAITALTDSALAEKNTPASVIEGRILDAMRVLQKYDPEAYAAAAAVRAARVA
jgi:hypothetical protein